MATATQAEIDRINGEVSAQAAKIAQLSTILDGKAGGGGSGAPQLVQIDFNVNTEDPYYVIYTHYENGVKIPKSFETTNHLGETIRMCCAVGDSICIHNSNGESRTPVVSDNITYVNVNPEPWSSNWAPLPNYEYDTVYTGTPYYWLNINSGTTGTITI